MSVVVTVIAKYSSMDVNTLAVTALLQLVTLSIAADSVSQELNKAQVGNHTRTCSQQVAAD